MKEFKTATPSNPYSASLSQRSRMTMAFFDEPRRSGNVHGKLAQDFEAELLAAHKAFLSELSAENLSREAIRQIEQTAGLSADFAVDAIRRSNVSSHPTYLHGNADMEQSGISWNIRKPVNLSALWRAVRGKSPFILDVRFPHNATVAPTDGVGAQRSP